MSIPVNKKYRLRTNTIEHQGLQASTGIPVQNVIRYFFEKVTSGMNNKNNKTFETNSLSMRVKSKNTEILAIQTELNMHR